MIGTAGPGPLWGGGSVPAGSPDVTLVSTNTVVEDNNRAGNLDTGGSPVGGQTWYARLRNTAHDPCGCGPGNGPTLGVNDGSSHTVVDWDVPVYAGRQDTDCPTPAGPVLAGYVVLDFGGVFEFGFTANYCNACGPITIDEQFTCDLWGPL